MGNTAGYEGYRPGYIQRAAGYGGGYRSTGIQRDSITMKIYSRAWVSQASQHTPHDIIHNHGRICPYGYIAHSVWRRRALKYIFHYIRSPDMGGIWQDMGDMPGYSGIQLDPQRDTAGYSGTQRDIAGYSGIQRDTIKIYSRARVIAVPLECRMP